ncbi:hypothetical protein CASFOL_008571 [Castilleja foliolosa]|uniref:Uncharacterized protein n=1 Tax=Castilleja foliolosa TaxID=1961234 RepID=A0ABD3DZD2_9LAMI
MAPMFHLSIIFATMLIYRSVLSNNTDQLQTYIVHVSLPDNSNLDLQNYYNSFLPDQNNNPHSHIIHTYRNVINGFAAKLTPNQLNKMPQKPGFLFAWPDKKYIRHTTHTPSFLGLYPNNPPWSKPTNYGKGIIIGLLDGGITPAHPSFDDKDVPPPPSNWKGKCEFNFQACNNKLIGARNLIHDEPGQPIDKDGHATHTASTAAGNFVPNANIYGQANGTASGVAPHAHLSIYKVCDDVFCSGADILAGIDMAIDDGVHVISISIGYFTSTQFYHDVIAIGSFAAMEKGIFVSCSAGNSGPMPSSVTNEAPWILTVGASTTDRRIIGVIKLGNGVAIYGESLGYPRFPKTSFPLVHVDDYAKIDNRTKAKIVLYMDLGLIDPVILGRFFKKHGAKVLVSMNEKIRAYDTDVYSEMTLPTIHVSNFDGENIKAYINSSSEPFATISFKGTILGADKMAPVVASFSSRGPSLASPRILKPDIIGPGINILAAWYKPMKQSIVGVNEKASNSYYNIESGTSMSCPHLGGVAALIKSVHPDWSPAMIKSAIMTTATQVNLNTDEPFFDERHIPADLYAVGAGHVDPSSALDPGLVYDIESRDYVSYLCSLYDKKQVEIIVREKVRCDGSDQPETELNYPSFVVELGNGTQTYSRTVTNVGGAKSTYKVDIEIVEGVDTIVEPTVLVFDEVDEKKTYKVEFSRHDYGLMVAANVSDYVQGAIAWVSADHRVRIPVSVHIVGKN